jgi:hypothetical protein
LGMIYICSKTTPLLSKIDAKSGLIDSSSFPQFLGDFLD